MSEVYKNRSKTLHRSPTVYINSTAVVKVLSHGSTG